MKILSVDDSAATRKYIKGAIDLLGLEFAEAEDGEKALEYLKAHKGEVGLILLDWYMPNLDGPQTLAELKKDPQTRDIPVTMVTTESEKNRIVSAIKAGATTYLIKPFSHEELIGKIMDLIPIDIA